jgi:uncharacterized protein YigE (DUF2233 family)
MLRWGLVLFAAMLSAADAAPCAQQVFEGASFTICTYDSRTEALRLYWKDARGAAYRNFDKLPQQGALFGMNAGMFEADGMPLGLYIENGKRLRPLNTRDAGGNFYMKPNGVFAEDRDGTLHIEPSDTFSGSPRWATQSGPMLVIAGKLHPQIAPDGPSQNIRNGVGLRDSHTAYFVISDDPVSFGRLARFFRDGLGCDNALYFDGAVSSAWIPAQHRMDQRVPLGPMVVVRNRP